MNSVLRNRISSRGGGPKETGVKLAPYLYALTFSGKERVYGSIGIGDSAVYQIVAGPVAAIVSDVPARGIRPERRNLAAHQKVLKRIMEDDTPLPVAFGVIADESEAVQDTLRQNEELILEQLRQVQDAVEMSLRVAWDVPNIFEHFVGVHLELRAARDRFFGEQREPTQEEKIQLGQLFDRLLTKDREAYADKVENALTAHCVEIKRNRCRSEYEVMNLSCLRRRADEAAFEAAVFEAASAFDNRFTFDYSGPWPPHNFVNLSLNF